ncbi:hypothetical protein AX16_000183 [Volvariella volvacea WC 439]|nr:hypothetical protein AX16_000183 [Volvariella volvacea WC 439]
MSTPEESEEQIVFSLDVDEDKLEDIANQTWGRGIFGPKRKPSEELEDGSSDPTTFAEIETGDSSFISVTFTTIQPLGDTKTLLVLLLRCHPTPGRRFTSATLVWKFKVNGGTPPRLVRIAPEMALGGWSEQQVKMVRGVNATAQTGVGAASAGLGASVEWENSRTLQHVMTFQGTIRGNGGRAHWTIQENEDLGRGIPSHIRVAAVLSHVGPIATELTVTAELGYKKWIIPLNDRRKSAQARVIDVEKWRRGEIDFGNGAANWETFMAQFSGDAPEYAVHSFGQAYFLPRQSSEST